MKNYLFIHKNFLKKEINTDEFMKLASIFYTIEALSSTIVPVLIYNSGFI